MIRSHLIKVRSLGRTVGGCASTLIRQKITNLNDEYHHVDPVGMFGVLTDASGNVLRSYVFDAFSDAPYKRQHVGESFLSQSNHTGTCQLALSEPSILTGSGGQGVVVPSRGFQVMGKKPGPVKKQSCMKRAPGSGNDGDGHTPWWVYCFPKAGIGGGFGMIVGGGSFDAGCLICLAGTAAACAAMPEFCAPLLYECTEWCGANFIGALLGWAGGYPYGWLECLASHYHWKWV